MTDQPLSEAEAREAVWEAYEAYYREPEMPGGPLAHGVHAALGDFKEAVLRANARSTGKPLWRSQFRSRIRELEADNRELREALEGLVALIDIANSGMSVLPFGKEGEIFDAAVERARRALADEG